MDGDIQNFSEDTNGNVDSSPSSSTGRGQHAGPSALPSATATTTPWGSAYEQWRDVRLKEQLTTKWDEAFGLVVEYKESTASEKHRLLTTVKEFAAGYKTDPTAERVEQLLRFFKRFISGLFERSELSERHFIGMYQSISMAPDPAPLLFAAHVEISSLVERVRDLQSECAAKSQDVANMARQQAAAMRDLAGAANGGDPGMPTSSSLSSVVGEVKDLRVMLDDMRAERRALVEMVRAGEAQTAAAKDEALLLHEQRRILSQQLLQAQTRYEEYVARNERDTNVLTAELAEAHEQLLLGANRPSGGAAANVQLVEALEGELESLRVAFADAEGRHARELAAVVTRAPDGSAVPSTDDNASAPDVTGSPTSSNVLQHLVGRLQEELAAAARSKDEVVATVTFERRRRREAEQDAEAGTRATAELKRTINGLQRTIDELRARVQTSTITHTHSTAGNAVPPVVIPQKSNDEVLSEMLLAEPKRDGASPHSTSNGLSQNDLNDPQLVGALVAQRDALRLRVSTVEQLLNASEREVDALRHALEAASHQKGPSGFLPVFGQKYRSTILASMPPSTTVMTQPPEGAIGVTIDGSSHPDGGGAADGRRRRKIQQTVRRAADGVAVLVANMVVHSPTTRLFLVAYLISLHVIVMVTTYAMAFRGPRSAVCRTQ